MGFDPPLESMRMFDQKNPTAIWTDATLKIGMLSSELPKKRGLMRSTRSGPTSMRVGKNRLPRVRRLAVNILVGVSGGLGMILFFPVDELMGLGGVVGFSFLEGFFLSAA